MPGGKIGFSSEKQNHATEVATQRFKELLQGEVAEFRAINDPKFVSAFITRIPDSTEQNDYVINSARFLHGESTYDPNHVLVFRRTLPSVEPQPENYWTSDYITARNGLRREIQGPHRLHTIIVCTRLKNIRTDARREEAGLSDGEINREAPPYDQTRALFSFQPEDQKRELTEYKQLKNSVTLEQLREQLRAIKGNKNDSEEEPITEPLSSSEIQTPDIKQPIPEKVSLEDIAADDFW